ncbi:MAG TPA: putative zinc-binding metallopeptidase [Polaromonas sp.]|uniref:zinc-binding metallopeptidase family protein n=1 Tax=Polaromonas sp. TaxID=1869339 RepID=UPI002D6C7457|nr:putative zinc-binding metallopeptidase [Polaromonas sp.]HYW58401.1 putative zinc-binding metallopeptidase [Polaromonas sp.]
MPHTSSSPANHAHLLGLAGRAYRCQCGCPVFFRNSICLACRTPLGYDPGQARLLPLKPGNEPDTWVAWDADEGAPAFLRCSNLRTPAACNWLVPVTAGQTQGLLCRACQLNRTIPDLNDPEHPDNGVLWGRVELAKRRLVSALLVLGLPLTSRVSEDPHSGLMFDFLRSPDYGPHILTGHDTGLITLNLNEADDATREAVRKAMHEPYRTLLGHLRHEVGHYYWDRLVAGGPWLDPFRMLFGDETQDYASSLRANYDEGPRPDWALHYVSAYASVHPWEDWAECWAHYLHMRDTVDTALSFGLSPDIAQLEFTAFTLDALYEPDHPEAESFLAFLNHWTQLTTMLNEMSRAMGQPDFYPFVLPHEVVAKLHFIHLLVSSVGTTVADERAPEAAMDEQTEVVDAPAEVTLAQEGEQEQVQGQQTGQQKMQGQSWS